MGPYGQPSLEEMTHQAINILSRNPNGFVSGTICFRFLDFFMMAMTILKVFFSGSDCTFLPFLCLLLQAWNAKLLTTADNNFEFSSTRSRI